MFSANATDGRAAVVGTNNNGVERPKPLKSTDVIFPNWINQVTPHSPEAEEILRLFGVIASDLRAGRYDATMSEAIATLNYGLKVHGTYLEQFYKEKLDSYQGALRNACKEGGLNLVARLRLLEIIELRAMKWKQNVNVTNYYKHKLLQVEQCDVLYQHSGRDGKQAKTEKRATLNADAPDFTPLSTSNYLSSATASLASLLSVGSSGAPGLRKPYIVDAKDGRQQSQRRSELRNVVGCHGDNSNNGESIQSNLPQKYSCTVDIGGADSRITIDGNNAELVKVAKIVLDDHFSGQVVEGTEPLEQSGLSECDGNQQSVEEKEDPGEQKEADLVVYERRSLFSYSRSLLCRLEPTEWSDQWEDLKAELARDGGNRVYFKPDPEHFMHELPQFPDGYVVRTHYAQHKDGAAAKKPVRGEGAVSHLDSLFMKGRQQQGRRTNNNVENFVCGMKYWDDARGEWIVDTNNTRL